MGKSRITKECILIRAHKKVMELKIDRQFLDLTISENTRVFYKKNVSSKISIVKV